MLISAKKVLKEFSLEPYEVLDWAEQGLLELYYKHPELAGLFKVKRHDIFDEDIFPFRVLKKDGGNCGILFPDHFDQVDEDSREFIEASMEFILYSRANSKLFQETEGAFKGANTIYFTDMLVDEDVVPALLLELRGEEGKTAGQNLADMRHGSTRPSQSAVNEIVSVIQKKHESGEYWHQTLECKAWLDRHHESKVTIKRLRKEVNKKLNTNALAIPPKKNSPRKK